MKGGFLRKMARNLVKEYKEEAPAAPEVKEETKPGEEKIVYVTTEQVLINNISLLIEQQKELYNKMIEGFKQVGVTFKEQ